MENKIVLYKSPTGKIDLKVSFDGETVWLTQKQMVELFNTDRTVIGRHISNIIKIGELREKSVCVKIAHTADDGKVYKTRFYNLDGIRGFFG